MRRPIVLLGLLLIAITGLMAAKSWLVQAPPLRAQAAAGQFDARRAKARLAFILGDERPHPADTDADDQVRARLTAQLRQMGLRPVIRDQLTCNELYKARGVSCARVRNVIAVLGSTSGKAVLVNAHYDSVPVGPGAADDGIGVATLLEVAANLKDRPLKRPVILLFNEGEELGLIGARAFLADPLSRNVDSLINLEARGVRGPVYTFETSRPNGAPIALFQATVNHPIANSLSTDVYRLLPNYTDVNSFSERGWLTLNLAPIGNETRYHSPSDSVEALDPATLQHMGDQTLALALALAEGAPKTNGDRIFMDLAGQTLVTLPMTVGVMILIVVLGGLAYFAWTRRQIVRSLAISLGTLVGSGVLAFVALQLVGIAHQGMFWRAHPIWTTLSAYACAMLAALVLLTTLGRRTDVRQLRAGFWLTYITLGAIIGLIAPGGIIFFLFPPLLALLGMIASRWWKSGETVTAILAVVLLYLTWGETLGQLEDLLNVGPMWIFAALGSLIILPILIEVKPLINRVTLREAAASAGGLVLVGLIIVATVPAYSADRQQRFVIQQVIDDDSGKAAWSILNDGAPLPRGYGKGWKRDKIPISDRLRWIEPAPAEPRSKAPAVELVSQVTSGSERTLMLRMHANRNERIELIAPVDAKIRSAGVQGFIRPIDQNESGKYLIDCSGRSCDGMMLEIVTDNPKPIQFTVVGEAFGFLSDNVARFIHEYPKFAEPQYNPDATITFTHVNL